MAKGRFRGYAKSAAGRVGRGVRTKSLLAGALAGAAVPLATKFAGKYGPALAMGGVGVAMSNDTLQVLAGVSLGASLTAGSGLLGSGDLPAGGIL